MSIKRTIITTIVALALVAVVAPVSAQTPTVAQLMAQLAQLQAQLAALQGTPATTGTAPAACAGVTFTRNLTVGATGSDVKCLQAVLNANGFKVSATGAGSPGMETTTFGPKTLVAVKAWQASVGFTPANQIGPMSRAKLNAILGGTAVSPVNPVNPVVTPAGSISAMTSSDSPMSGAIVASQAAADLLHIAFSGTGVVTSVTLQRSGFSDQNTLSNVYLYDGNVRITDGYSFNVSGQMIMNGLNIVVNGTHVISVRGDVAATSVVGSSGSSAASSIAVQMIGYTGNSTAMTSSVQGNTMNIVIGSLATASLSANTVTGSPTVNAGVTQYTFWSAPIQVNTRAVLLKTASFKMIGSAPSDALANINMFVDGVSTGKTATVMAINGSNYVMFDLTSSPISLTTGSHTIDVRADVQKGTSRTVQLVLQQAADLTITDPQVGVNLAVSTTNIPNGISNSVTISTGSVTVVVDPTFTNQTNISGGATNAVIGRFKLHAYGENVKVQTLNVIPEIDSATSSGGTCTTSGAGVLATGTCGLNNVTLYFNGAQVGSQINYSVANGYTMGTTTSGSGTAIPFQLGSQVIVPAGTDSTLEIRADLQTNGNIAYTGGTIKVGLPLETTNGIGQSSQASVAVPTAAVNIASGLTIGAGGLQLSSNTGYLAQSITPNASGVKIGSFVVQNQSTSQGIRMTSLSLVTSTVTATINNFSALRTSNTTGSGSTPTQFSGTGTGTTSTDVFSINDTLAPGASETIDVFANTGSTPTGSILEYLTVSYIGAVDNIATTTAQKVGQVLSLGTGTISNPPTIVVSSTTPAQYISAAGGATNAAQATFNLVSTSGASTITEMKFTVSGGDATLNSNTNVVTNVCVGTICSAPISGVADITGLSLAVPNGGGGLPQPIQVSFTNVGTTGINPNTSARISLTYLKYTTGSSSKTLCVTPATVSGITYSGTCDDTFSGTNSNDGSSNKSTYGVTTPLLVLVGSQPIPTVSSTIAAGLQLGQVNKVGEVTVKADTKGAVELRTITFSVSSSGFKSTTPFSVTSAGSSTFIAIGSTQITGSSCQPVAVTNSTATITCSMGTASTYAADYAIAAGQQQTFSLYATVNGGPDTSATCSVASSITSAGFVWDDTSNNGGVGSTGLTGASIYNFPTNAYSIHQ